MGMGEDEAWNATCKEWLIDEGYCYAGGVAGKADCVFYGAAAMDGLDKWECVFKDPRTETITISDEETQQVQVDETNILWEVITNGTKGKYPSGVWIGGGKYTLVRSQDLEVQGKEVTVIFGAKKVAEGEKPKGVCICCSDQSVVLGFNDEGRGQNGGNCQKAVLNMVGYLFQSEG